MMSPKEIHDWLDALPSALWAIIGSLVTWWVGRNGKIREQLWERKQEFYSEMVVKVESLIVSASQMEIYERNGLLETVEAQKACGLFFDKIQETLFFFGQKRFISSSTFRSEVASYFPSARKASMQKDMFHEFRALFTKLCSRLSEIAEKELKV